MIVLRHTRGRLVRTQYPPQRTQRRRLADVVFWTVVGIALAVLLLIIGHDTAQSPKLTIDHTSEVQI